FSLLGIKLRSSKWSMVNLTFMMYIVVIVGMLELELGVGHKHHWGSQALQQKIPSIPTPSWVYLEPNQRCYLNQ
ncbi:hypothetical protein KI387_037558, partial [Taxus chinensis]